MREGVVSCVCVFLWLCVRALACAWACCAWERGSGEMITEMLQQETEVWFMAIVIAGGMETLWRSRGSAKEPYARRPYGIIRSKQQMASNSR